MNASHASVAKPQAATSPRKVQRDCACGSCEKCRKKKLQRKAQPGAGNGFVAAPALFESGGSPLAPALRGRLEPLFGADFSAVRIHDDASSHGAARDLHANAFTWGQHIHFGAGRYRPDSGDGLHLLAHELTHTVQQRGSAPVAAADAIEVDAVDSPLEREADSVADAVLAGRAAAVRPAAGAAPLQRDAAEGNAEIDHPTDAKNGVRIRRTMRERKCDKPTYVPKTQSTPRDKIFKWDRQANALELNYSICRGKVRLTTKGEIDYDKVIEAGKGLLKTLQNNPSAGADLPALANGAIDEARIDASGQVTLTVDGVLQASVGSESKAGASAQSIRVTGELRVTPRSVSFTLKGFVDFSHTQGLDASQYSLNLRVGTQWVAVNLGYLNDQRSPAGGSTTTKQTLKIGLEIPLPNVLGLNKGHLEPSLSVDLESGKPDFQPGLTLKIPFGGPDKTPAVSCYECRCPPPLPEYTCTPYGTKKVVDVEGGTRRPVLLYEYDKDQPADQNAFDAQVTTIANLAGQGYLVQSIRGYASPEGKADYNQALAQRRADKAHAAISPKLPAGATLPQAEGIGELFGESSGRPGEEARNGELSRELSSRLSALGPDERLDLMGVEQARRDNPEQRRKDLADIEAFVQGRDARGRRLAERARWEKAFPFLRRVEVQLEREEKSHPERVDHPEKSGACGAEDRAYIDQQKPIPESARLPTDRCDK